jgi:hypothetical protein
MVSVRQTDRALNGGSLTAVAVGLHLTASQQPPAGRVAGADAVVGVEQKAKDLPTQVDSHRELPSSLSHDAT